MKKYYKWIVSFILLVLVVLVGILYFGDTTGEYHFYSSLIDDKDNLKIDVIVMKNNNGNLLIYNTNIAYSDKDIVAGRLFIKNNEEKKVILGNNLNMYDYASKNEYKKEYGNDYIEDMLKNSNSLYFDLCLDTSCDNIYETIKLEYDKLH